MPFSADTPTLSRLTIASEEQTETIQTEIRRVQSAIAGKSMHDADPLASPSSGEPNLAPSMIEGQDVALPDYELLLHSLERDQETLVQNSAPALTGGEKNDVYRYYKEMSKAYADGLLSHQQMRDASSTNVQQFLSHQEQMAQVGMALRNAVRILDNAEAFSLDALRPTQPNYRNMAEWYKRFDQIQWADDTQVELQSRNLDETTYLQFLILHAKRVDKSVLKTKININEVTYEACLKRFEEELSVLSDDLDLRDDPPPARREPTSSGELTRFEARMVAAHATSLAPLLAERERFSRQDLKATLGISDKDAMGLLRGMCKRGYLSLDKESKDYLVNELEAA